MTQMCDMQVHSFNHWPATAPNYTVQDTMKIRKNHLNNFF